MTLVWGLVAVAVAGAVFFFIAAPLRRASRAAADADAPTPLGGTDERETRAAQHNAVRAAIRELELDYRLGKLTSEDYHLLRAQYAREAVALAGAAAPERFAGGVSANGKAVEASSDSPPLERAARRSANQAAPRRPRIAAGAALLGLVAVVAVAGAVAVRMLFGGAGAGPVAAPAAPGRDTAAPDAAASGSGAVAHDVPAGDGAVAGHVVNGTTGAPAPSQDVVLTLRSDSGETSERTTTADGDGNFAFSGLPQAGYTYELAAGYQHVAYRTNAFHVSDVKSPVEVRVYEPTDHDPGLHVTRALLVLGGVDAARQEVGAHEVVTLSNPSSQTYVPGKDSGPMGLLRFALPPGAHDLTATIGLSAEQMLQVDRGFATLAAVPPGERDYGFAYYFPFRPSTYRFSLALPYGADSLRVLAPLGGPEIHSPKLTPVDPVTLEGERYRAWSGQGFNAGDELSLEVSGLPARPLWLTLAGLVARPWAAAACFLGAMLAAVGWVIRPRSAGPRTKAQPAAAGASRGARRRARARVAMSAGEAPR